MDARQIRQLKPRLGEYLRQFDDCFPRRDTRAHLPVYVEGQLSDLPQKSVEPIALKGNVPPRTLQQFLASFSWDEDRMGQHLQEIVAREHASPRAIGIIDETSDPKKGDKTPGVQRQHCGAVGKQDNCIVTVHLGYAADDFHCLLDGELFLPESWSNDRARCREAGIPDTMTYRPKTEIALELYDRARSNGIALEWLTFDEWYGGKPPFLRALDQRGQKFVGEVPKNYWAWTEPPPVTKRPFRRRGTTRTRRQKRVVAGSRKAISVAVMLRRHPPLRDQPWQRYRVKDGEKGPQVWEVKHLFIYPKDADGLPNRRYHLLVARNVLDPSTGKYFISNAPPETSVETLLLVAFSRWRVERCFEDEKGELGLDHYEGRKYPGLKRHMIISAVSHLFLAKVQQDLAGKKSRPDSLPSPSRGGERRAQPLAIRTQRRPLVRTNGQGTLLLPGTQRPSPEEPHQNRETQTTQSWHSPNQRRTLPLGFDIAL
jgi:SRSO17 transposase